MNVPIASRGTTASRHPVPILKGQTPPWSAATILLISILWTPVVGAILAAVNTRRFDASSRTYRHYVLASLLAMSHAVLRAYTFSPHLEFSFGDSLYTLAIAMFLFPTLDLLITALPSPTAFTLLGLIPMIAATSVIYRQQSQLLRLGPRTGATRNSLSSPSHFSWSTAYFTALLLGMALSLFLLMSTYVLTETEFTCYLNLGLDAFCP